MLRLPTLAACCLIAVSGCTPPASSTDGDKISSSVESEKPDHLGVKDWSTFKVMLERIPCHGVCPSYFVEIAGNGQVRYCGGLRVKESGIRTKTISVAAVRALAELLSEAKFFDLQDEYVGGMDAPGQVLRLSFDGKTKKIVEILGENAGVPESVRQIGQAIDDMADTRSWVGTPTDNPEGDGEACFKLAREEAPDQAPAPL